jgi:DNA invertase Pin-like site-specific DNA recombinase
MEVNSNSNNTDNSKIYGYMRLSKRDRSKVDTNGNQLSDNDLILRQKRELMKFGISESNIISEGITSGVGNKPILYNLLGLSADNLGRVHQSDVCKLPKGSTLCVCEMNRLSRDKFELTEILKILEQNEIGLIFLNFPMLVELAKSTDNTSWLLRKLILTVLIYISDEERKILIERTKQGLETAKAQGKVLGRPPFNSQKKVHEIFLKYNDGLLSWQKGARLLNLGKTQFYKLMKQERKQLFQ